MLRLHFILLALFVIESNCFTIDMYSGLNHIHYESTLKVKDSNETGTHASFIYYDTGESFNKTLNNYTSLETALDLIVNSYNNHTDLNKTRIVMDKVPNEKPNVRLDKENNRILNSVLKNKKINGRINAEDNQEELSSRRRVRNFKNSIK
ncbi:unnamed protein product [Brachionus calyciflorus]|uniref:Uncharacterized protein n=1 Tax=Brachionus calyciflorus TaxID=104777 RepID=A0A813SDQ5_9BILA|nr:unnamed protein product [Brachionus calyciflorus]